MINSSNKISFTGMSPLHVKRFIPSMAESEICALSKKLDKQLPRDILEVSAQDKNQITHFGVYGKYKLPIRIFNYTGSDEIFRKVRFLEDIVDFLGKNID